MNRETKIGILTVVCIAGLIWGYTFLKGRNLLSRSLTIYAIFDRVEDLPVSAPVLVSGLQVGTVQDQYLNNGNPREIVVVMDIQRRIKLPKDAVVVIQSTSLMGGKSIRLDYTAPCSNNCAQSGDTLVGRHEGLLNTLLPAETLNSYLNNIKENIGGIIDSLDHRLSQDGGPTVETINDLRNTIKNMSSITARLNDIVLLMGNQLTGISKDLKQLSGVLASESRDIEESIQNINKITTQISDANIGRTLTEAGSTMENLNYTVQELRKVSVEAQQTLSKINDPNGTLGLLINDRSLYQNLDRTTRNLDLLLQDFRLNPKRYVHVSVFGKKQKSYILPEADPALPVLPDTTNIIK